MPPHWWNEDFKRGFAWGFLMGICLTELLVAAATLGAY